MWYSEVKETMEAIRKPEMRLNVKLAITFVGVNILDAALTLRAIANGGYELCSIPSLILRQPTWVFWCFKISTALIFALLLLILSDRFPQVKRIFIILIGVMSGICLFNTIGVF